MNFEINWGNIEWGGIILMFFMYYLVVLKQYVAIKSVKKDKKDIKMFSVMPNIFKKGKFYHAFFSMFKFNFLFAVLSLIVFFVTLFDIGRNIKIVA